MDENLISIIVVSKKVMYTVKYRSIIFSTVNHTDQTEALKHKNIAIRDLHDNFTPTITMQQLVQFMHVIYIPLLEKIHSALN